MALYAIGDLHLSLGADKPWTYLADRGKLCRKIKLGFRPCTTTMSACSAVILPGA